MIIRAILDGARKPTHLWEGGNLRTTGRLDVVDGHSTVGRTSKVVGDLRNTSEGSVLVPEVHDGSPVVGLVLLELATRAGRHLGDVVVEIHSDVETRGAGIRTK